MPKTRDVMYLTDLLKLLVAELPTTDLDEEDMVRDPVIPFVAAETDHRQYSIVGLRRNDLGDVILQLRSDT